MDFTPRPLTAEERETAWHAANFYDAISHSEHPIALWILGPSSVGKSTLTAQAAPSFGINARFAGDEKSKDERSMLDAVIIDGEYMRDAHNVYLEWVKTPDWRSAYPALKSIINKEKDKMCTEAASHHKHLVIPQTLLNLEKGLTEVEELTRLGYTNHVLAVVAPFEECRRRGAARETVTGKRYEGREFDKSISSIQPMVSACNGRYEVVRALEVEGSDANMRFETLKSGRCGGYVGGISQLPNDALPESGDAFLSLVEFYRLVQPVVGKKIHADVLSSPAISPRRVHHAKPDLGSSGAALVPRRLTKAERERMWQTSHYHKATSSNENPVAVWIIGPPCVGKTTFVQKLGPRPLLPSSTDAEMDAVLVDGELLREVHGVYQSWMKTSDWGSAGSALKSMLNKEKDELCTQAAVLRKHLVIGRRLTDLNKGLTEMDELLWQGYTVHVIAIVATLEDCQDRAAASRKQCLPSDYEQSILSIPPMMAACNGRYELLKASLSEGSFIPHDGSLDFEVCLRGQGRERTSPATSLGFSPPAELAEAVAKAISGEGGLLGVEPCSHEMPL
eukprot:TRINITY_DN43306_c0_g1_i1.p1 TRINITY_DN43306_c0_g1~~TRINITY_DN43306_c0_g1_i1.p1  ORF type:complete len:564 (+),score=105.17 TRINITY_DN43306_c0_g1_i1:95-1786(+)